MLFVHTLKEIYLLDIRFIWRDRDPTKAPSTSITIILKNIRLFKILDLEYNMQ